MFWLAWTLKWLKFFVQNGFSSLRMIMSYYCLKAKGDFKRSEKIPPASPTFYPTQKLVLGFKRSKDGCLFTYFYILTFQNQKNNLRMGLVERIFFICYCAYFLQVKYIMKLNGSISLKQVSIYWYYCTYLSGLRPLRYIVFLDGEIWTPLRSTHS